MHVNIGKSLNIFTDLRYYRYANIGTDTDTDNNIGTSLIKTHDSELRSQEEAQ